MGDNVPIDKEKVAQLDELFTRLSNNQTTFLLTRFPGCDTDAEACDKVGPNVSTLGDWKKQTDFIAAYKLLASRLVDWSKWIAAQIDLENSSLAATELRALLKLPWGRSARTDSAKATACNQILERVIGRRADVLKPIQLGDLDEGL